MYPRAGTLRIERASWRRLPYTKGVQWCHELQPLSIGMLLHSSCALFLWTAPPESSARLTIQPSFAAIRTMGLTPHAAIAATASCIALSSDCQCPADAGSVLCNTSQWLCYHRCFHAPCLPRPSQNHNVLDYGLGVSLACLGGYDEPWNTSREWKLPRHVSRIKETWSPKTYLWSLPDYCRAASASWKPISL